MSKLSLTLRESRYGTISLHTAVVQKDAWPPEVAEWMWPAIVDFAKLSELQPQSKTTWDILKLAIPALNRVKSWRQFVAIPIADLDVEDVRDMFIDLDAAFHTFWTTEQAAVRSSTLRRFILAYLQSLRPDGNLARVRGSYKPMPRHIPNHRALIDDEIEVRDGKAVAPPIGALPHKTPKELKESTRNRLKSTLDRIQDACLREIDDFNYACSVIHELRSSSIDPELETRVFEKIAQDKSRPRGTFDALTLREKEALLCHYLRKDIELDAKFESTGYWGSSLLEDDLSLRMGLSPMPFLRCSRYEYYPLQNTLIAALILVLVSTGWNASSGLLLSEDKITPISGDSFLVQSIKPKTGLDTPQVLLEGDDNPGVIAIRFLLTRLARLRSRNWVREGEKNLWLSPRSNYTSRRGQPISNVAKGLAQLIEKHGLPKFSFDQLRVQTLTVISVTNGPVRAAEVAGHSTFATIGGYIDHLVTHRINSSINLEFQKRWENEVVARITKAATDYPLMPIGDGASCMNPKSPPDPRWLHGDSCEAAFCHAGNGCPNRTLVIDRARVEEVLLTAAFYRSNWKSLYSSNPKEFAEIHLPRIEFNFLLKNYLEQGPYRQLVHGRT